MIAYSLIIKQIYFFYLINERMKRLNSSIGKELRHSKLHRLIPHILGLKKYQYAVLFLESGRKVRWILETHFGIDIH